MYRQTDGRKDGRKGKHKHRKQTNEKILEMRESNVLPKTSRKNCEKSKKKTDSDVE